MKFDSQFHSVELEKYRSNWQKKTGFTNETIQAQSSKDSEGVRSQSSSKESDQTQDQNVPNISRSVYVGLNWCQKFHLRVVMAIKICLGVEIKIKIAPQR